MKRTTQAKTSRKAAKAGNKKSSKPVAKKGKAAPPSGKKGKEAAPVKRASKPRSLNSSPIMVKRVSRRYFIKSNGGLKAYKLVKDTVTQKPMLVLDPLKKPLLLPVRRMERMRTLEEGDELFDGDVITLDDANPMAVVIVVDDPATGNTCTEVEPTTDPNPDPGDPSPVDYELEVDLSEIECFEEYYDEESSADETTWYFGDDDTTIGIEG